MIEGWHNEDYLILFEGKQEEALFTQRYGVADYLPRYAAIGLWGWDDFLLRDEKTQYYTVATVPISAEFLHPFPIRIDSANVRQDAKLVGKIKWYIKPIIFGGDPQAAENMAWLSFDQHIKAVKWWNKLYRDVKGKTGK